MAYTVLLLGIFATVVSAQFSFSRMPARCEQQRIKDFSNCEFSPFHYFNHRTQNCEFSYMNCGSKLINNFMNKKACVKACGCHATPDEGQCMGKNKTATERYYFNSMMNFCMPFMYSGCGGNDNNFRDMWKCQMTCGGGMDGMFDFF